MKKTTDFITPIMRNLDGYNYYSIIVAIRCKNSQHNLHLILNFEMYSFFNIQYFIHPYTTDIKKENNDTYKKQLYLSMNTILELRDGN